MKTTTVTIEVERDSEGKQWVVIRCACHGWRAARRQTFAEARELVAKMGWGLAAA